MELSVVERLTLLGILPAEGSFLTLKIVRKLRESLSFSEEEHKVLDFKYGGQTFIDDDGKEQTVPANAIQWKMDAPQNTEIEIGPQALKVITDALKKLDAEGKLTDRHFSLYEKFVEVK